jgi:hypothetical protein
VGVKLHISLSCHQTILGIVKRHSSLTKKHKVELSELAIMSVLHQEDGKLKIFLISAQDKEQT